MTIVPDMYHKIQGYDGEDLFIDSFYMVQKAWNLKEGANDIVANVWSLRTFNRNIHIQIPIENSGIHTSAKFKRLLSYSAA
jgi:hypothetical protein